MANKQEIIKALKNNEVVIVPTDTVWGMIALFSEANSKKIALIKGNNLDKKYSVMFKDKKDALMQWEDNLLVKDLVEKHFPGDLTIIAKEKNSDELLGIRIPDDKVLLSIIKQTGPIIATSANKANKPPLTKKEDLIKAFPQLKILDGKAGNKKPSTIVKVEQNNFLIVRQGDKAV